MYTNATVELFFMKSLGCGSFLSGPVPSGVILAINLPPLVKRSSDLRFGRFPEIGQKSAVCKAKWVKAQRFGGLLMSGMVILEGFTLIYKGVFQNFPPAAGSHMVFFRRVCPFTKAISKIFACGAQNTSVWGEIARRRRKILAF